MVEAVTILGRMRFDRMSNIFCSALVLYSGTQNVLLLCFFVIFFDWELPNGKVLLQILWEMPQEEIIWEEIMWEEQPFLRGLPIAHT